ncbi:MAG: 1,4-dihydroxy-2-naphthoate octaprenyltransferase [Alloprevotella sp.]|nr:1,4-dihydroxy-2-naphthoate octaprenyltransferase [Alloprevotella sp.]
MPTNKVVRPGSLRAWILAARPKTLSAALAPVVVASAFAFADGRMRPMLCILCLLFAGTMQIAANLINDVLDFRRGTDGEDRLGPERACAQGWLSPRACWRGIAVLLLLAALLGLAIVVASGAWIDWSQDGMHVDWTAVLILLGVGVACGVFAFLYTSLLSYVGCGDLLVYLFFGFVPVLGTYYVQALALPAHIWWTGAAVGLVVDTLLILNNYRDRETDRAAGKRTLVAIFGERFGSLFYLLHGLLGTACAYVALVQEAVPAYALLLPLVYVGFHFLAWRTMTHIRTGRALNRVLGLTSQGILLFALTLSLAALTK